MGSLKVQNCSISCDFKIFLCNTICRCENRETPSDEQFTRSSSGCLGVYSLWNYNKFINSSEMGSCYKLLRFQEKAAVVLCSVCQGRHGLPTCTGAGKLWSACHGLRFRRQNGRTSQKKRAKQQNQNSGFSISNDGNVFFELFHTLPFSLKPWPRQ